MCHDHHHVRHDLLAAFRGDTPAARKADVITNLSVGGGASGSTPSALEILAEQADGFEPQLPKRRKTS